MENFITYTCVTIGGLVVSFLIADILFGAEAVSETIGGIIHAVFF